MTTRKRSYVPRPLRDSPEWKYSDTVNLSSGLSSTPVLWLLNGLRLGNTASSRIGRSVNITTLLISTSLIATGTSFNTHVRMIVYYDRQANALAPSISGGLLEPSAPLILSPRSLNNRKRFKIIVNKIIPVGTITEGGLSPIGYFEYFHRFEPPLEVNYNSADGGLVSDIVTNSLYFTVFCDVVSGGPQCYFYGRIRYIDV